uniref:Uncharacterized protein n=1 Tax=Pectobacterium phage Amona TaxID=3158137 RepID=A0AB39ABC1_9CAUD
MANNTDVTNTQCRMFALVAEMEAMKACNARDAHEGRPPCYQESDFLTVASRFEELARNCY